VATISKPSSPAHAISVSKRTIELQRTHGLGVRPARYSSRKLWYTSRPKISSVLTTMWRMPARWHTERASSMASIEQQLRSGAPASP
jgi:hypothetical protein